VTELRQRQPPIREPAYLAWLRKRPCACGCGKPPPSDAAHLRSGSIAYGKEYPGLGAKPSDMWAMPLNRSCHMRQHAYGDELGFWSAHGMSDPFGRSMRYYAEYQAECPSKPAGEPAASQLRKPKVRAKPHYEPREPRWPKFHQGTDKPSYRPRSQWVKGRKIPKRRKP
jgi:hypothetical protein